MQNKRLLSHVALVIIALALIAAISYFLATKHAAPKQITMQEFIQAVKTQHIKEVSIQDNKIYTCFSKGCYQITFEQATNPGLLATLIQHQVVITAKAPAVKWQDILSTWWLLIALIVIMLILLFIVVKQRSSKKEE